MSVVRSKKHIFLNRILNMFSEFLDLHKDFLDEISECQNERNVAIKDCGLSMKIADKYMYDMFVLDSAEKENKWIETLVLIPANNTVVWVGNSEDDEGQSKTLFQGYKDKECDECGWKVVGETELYYGDIWRPMTPPKLPGES